MQLAQRTPPGFKDGKIEHVLLHLVARRFFLRSRVEAVRKKLDILAVTDGTGSATGARSRAR